MLPIVQRDVFKCARCGHEWLPRGSETPTRCAKCKSPYWHKPKEKSWSERVTFDSTKDNLPIDKQTLTKLGEKYDVKNVEDFANEFLRCMHQDKKKEIKKTT